MSRRYPALESVVHPHGQGSSLLTEQLNYIDTHGVERTTVDSFESDTRKQQNNIRVTGEEKINSWITGCCHVDGEVEKECMTIKVNETATDAVESNLKPRNCPKVEDLVTNSLNVNLKPVKAPTPRSSQYNSSAASYEGCSSYPVNRCSRIPRKQASSIGAISSHRIPSKSTKASSLMSQQQDPKVGSAHIDVKAGASQAKPKSSEQTLGPPETARKQQPAPADSGDPYGSEAEGGNEQRTGN